jgi:hypothetical protein
MKTDVFGSRSSFDTGFGRATIYRLDALSKDSVAPGLARLPFSIKVLLEACLRNLGGCTGLDQHANDATAAERHPETHAGLQLVGVDLRRRAVVEQPSQRSVYRYGEDPAHAAACLCEVVHTGCG